MAVFDELSAVGLVPVVEIPSVEQAVPLARTLLGAGLPCVEITLRTAAGVDAIRATRDGCPDLLVGAGTVLTFAQADAAIDAGAAFLVAPGLNPRVVRHAQERGAIIIPGVCTPTEIEAALAEGLEVLKFFPAEVAGGVPFLKAVAAVYRSVRFIPTGGIGPTNLAAYLGLSQVLACGGSWMATRQLIAAGDLAAIGRSASEAVALVTAARADRSAAAPAVGLAR